MNATDRKILINYRGGRLQYLVSRFQTFNSETFIRCLTYVAIGYISACLLSIVILRATTRTHPESEICNTMYGAASPGAAALAPCTAEQFKLLHTPHDHDAQGNIWIMTRDSSGKIVRTKYRRPAPETKQGKKAKP